MLTFCFEKTQVVCCVYLFSSMSNEAYEDTLLQSFICPITRDLMSEPVFLLDDGHSYEKSALDSYFETGQTISPITGKQLISTNYISNDGLQHAIEVCSQGYRCFECIRRLSTLHRDALFLKCTIHSHSPLEKFAVLSATTVELTFLYFNAEKTVFYQNQVHSAMRRPIGLMMQRSREEKLES